MNDTVPAPRRRLDARGRILRIAGEAVADEARKKLFDTINRVAANLGLNHARTAAVGAPENEGSKVAAGNEVEKGKMPRGSAQVFEKARFGEGNPRISLAQIWPGFAGFGSDLAQFGFS
jgi:hypothetical protein